MLHVLGLRALRLAGDECVKEANRQMLRSDAKFTETVKKLQQATARNAPKKW